MKKKYIFVLIVLLLLSAIIITGCDGVKVSESRDDGFFSTKKSETKCGVTGCKTDSRSCPFWGRDC